MNSVTMARSNYFRVKNAKEFESWCNKVGVTFIKQDEDDGLPAIVRESFQGSSGLVGFMCDLGSDGLPNTLYNDDGSYEDIEFLDELPKFLADGSVAVVMEVSYEGMRYLHGWAWAGNNKFEFKEVTLRSIYELAETLGNVETEAEL